MANKGVTDHCGSITKIAVAIMHLLLSHDRALAEMVEAKTKVSLSIAIGLHTHSSIRASLKHTSHKNKHRF